MFFSTITLNNKDDIDRDFIKNLYKEYYFIMKKQVINIVKNETVADDIVHDAVIKFMVHIDTIRILKKQILLAYIIITVKRMSYNYLNSRYIKDCLYTAEIKDSYIEITEDKNVNIEEYVVMKISMEELKILLMRLPQRYQEILKFKYLLNMNDKEISEALDISLSGVRVYLKRAREQAYIIALEWK